MSEAASARLESFAARRLSGEPVFRILGVREFWGLDFALSSATLEPRPDSETIVDAALAALAPRRGEALRLLDLGTGTGCLLLAALAELPAARGLGIDLSAEACATAAGNAERLGLGHRAAFRCGSWTDELEGTFDLILSNPPYIPTSEIAGLSREVREHDPKLALDGGPDGLDAYRALAAAIPPRLAPQGVAVLEIGAGQEEDVVRLLTQGGLACVGARRDLGGHVRALTFRSKEFAGSDVISLGDRPGTR